MLEIYKNIRFFRKKRKMSQEQLAKLTGYTDRSSIAKIEKGEIDIPQSKIKQTSVKTKQTMLKAKHNLLKILLFDIIKPLYLIL